MRTKEIVVGDKKFQLKELLYLDVVELGNIESKKEHAIRLLELSGVNKEEINNLNANDGVSIMKEINELNGFVDFPKD